MKIAKKRIQTMASLREKSLLVAPVMLISKNNTTRAVEMSKSSGSSLLTVLFLMRIGLIIAAMPINNSILMMLLPITLPSSMSVLLVARAEIETANSGAPVPIATMVRPMSCFETLKCEAMDEAPETSQSVPLMRKTKPSIRIRI